MELKVAHKKKRTISLTALQMSHFQQESVDQKEQVA